MQREINGTGIRVKAIGLGAMPLSVNGRPSEAQAIEVIKAFLELGGDFIDTANVYCLADHDIGHNEQLIAKALDRLGKREGVVIATKGGLRRPMGDWKIDGDPAWLRASCEKSLRDLEVSSIDLYQLHAVDPNIGLLPTLNELVRLREEGLVHHIGLSNINLPILQEALDYAPIVSVQNRCNLLEKRDFAEGLVEFCGARGITYIPHSPVGGHYGHVRLPKHPVIGRLAEKYKASPYCIALAWLLAKGDHILPIPGASKVSSIQDSMKALTIQLEPADIEAIDQMPDEKP